MCGIILREFVDQNIANPRPTHIIPNAMTPMRKQLRS